VGRLGEGNVDTDATIDKKTWSISTDSRTSPPPSTLTCSVGGNSPSGEPPTTSTT